MKIIWTQTALDSLQVERDFLYKQWGWTYLREFVRMTKELKSRLLMFPTMEPIEPLLEHLNQDIRSVFVTPYTKYIYIVRGEIIYILDVWDTRREPKQQINQIVENI